MQMPADDDRRPMRTAVSPVACARTMSRAGLTQETRPQVQAEYSPATLEARWQETWRSSRAFVTPAPPDGRAGAYVFAECPRAEEGEQIEQVRTYAIADACARFLRARGRAVLFSLGFDSPAVGNAPTPGPSPRERARRCCGLIVERLQALGCSCDWERTFVSFEPDHYRWTQWLFLAMLERDLVYRRDGRWLMRVDLHIDENERGLAELTDWDGRAIELQRATIGRVEGVEMRASTLAGELTVFTPHAEAFAKATFVAISPAHPDIERWAADAAIAKQVAGMREAALRDGVKDEPTAIVVTDVLATVPGIEGMLPLVVSQLVDERYGASAVLGIPELDPADREMAERLPSPLGTTWKTSSSRAATRPAVRYSARDLAISSQRSHGTPIPLVDCPACGAVPVPVEDLPVRRPEDLQADADEGHPAEGGDFDECPCPRCGGPALRERGAIDRRVDRMWMWMPVCVPRERRSSAMMNDPEFARWLPAQQVVSDVDAAADMFERRMLAEILQDIGTLPPLPSREPFSKALMRGAVRVQATTISEELGDVADVDQLIARVGSDTVRLAMLHAAAPGRAFTWNDQRLRQSQRFLHRLYGYAKPPLVRWAQIHDQAPAPAGFHASDKLRRRLALWCTTACEKITAQLERVELQRVAHNEMLLLTRIEDFESRAVSHRGELQELDREAIVAALLVLVRLLAPLAPHICEELWSAAGNPTLVGDAGWPRLSRPKRAVQAGEALPS